MSEALFAVAQPIQNKKILLLLWKIFLGYGNHVFD